MVALNSGAVFARLRRIAELAREHPGWSFRSLGHVIDNDRLAEAYRRTRKDGASGVDGQTADEYAVNMCRDLRRQDFDDGPLALPVLDAPPALAS